jgi:hypothetical protein
MSDKDDGLRHAMLLAGQPAADLKASDGPVWDTAALQRDFQVISFSAPFVVVRRRRDGVMGSLEFTRSPRVYFGFVETTEKEGPHE